MTASSPSADNATEPRVLLVTADDAKAGKVREAFDGLDAAHQVVVERQETIFDAIAQLRKSSYLVLFVDCALPEGDGTASLRTLSAIGNSTPVVLLSETDDARRAMLALRSGASDVVLSTELTPVRFAEALDHAKRGGTWLFEDWRSDFQRMVERSHDGILILDAAGSVLYANGSADAMLNATSGDLIGEQLGFPLDGERPIEVDILRDGEPGRGELRIQEIIWDGQPGYSVTLRDTTVRKRAEQALRDSEERYALAARGANDGLWDWNLTADTIYFSDRWKTMLGCTDEDLAGTPQDWYGRVHPDDLERLKRETDEHLAGQTGCFEHECRMLRQNGSTIWVMSRGIAVRDALGNAYRFVGSLTDINDRKIAEEKLLHDAQHDELTQLCNRSLLTDRLQHTILRGNRRKRYQFAVLFLDLDRFKIVNDSLGHAIGDRLLISVARRLEQCVREVDTVARLGGDEFAIILDDIQDLSDATRVAERILTDLTLPFQLEGREVFTAASIGIAHSDSGYSSAEEMLRDADNAMYVAKDAGRACYRIFDSVMHERAVTRLTLENELRRSIARGEMGLHFQPIVCLKTGKLVGFETLARWFHPDHGNISPARFIPIAEETGLILPLGRWVLEQSCKQMQKWHEQYPRDADPLWVSVNLSIKQLHDPTLVAQTREMLASTGFSPELLRLEITESTLMDNADVFADVFRQFEELQVRFALDDFGTGYSSLAYLHMLPIKTLKIDRGFAWRLTGDQDREMGKRIVSSILSLAKSLEFGVVAEGIEEQAQLDILRALDCPLGQGYFFSRPLPAEEAERLLRDKHTWKGRLTG